jgi:hypothetical protein
MKQRGRVAAVVAVQLCAVMGCSGDIAPPGPEDGNGAGSGTGGSTGGTSQVSTGGTGAVPVGTGGTGGTTPGTGGTGAGKGGTGGTGAGKGGTGGAGTGGTGGTGTGGTSSAGSGGKGGSGGSGGSGNTAGTGGSPNPTGNIANCAVFPPSSPWNTDVSKLPVHSNSDNFISSIGRGTAMHADFGTVWQGAPIGIPYSVVSNAQALVPIQFTAYGDESDPGPYPVPLSAGIEGGPSSKSDRHVIAINTDTCTLYELYSAYPTASTWKAGCGAVWDLKTNSTRKLGWTSADAAGLPIFPGLVRYDEVVQKGVISHALRFTVDLSQAAYVAPATHYASDSTNPNYPPMGLRVRMKAGFNCGGYSSEVQVICTALKRYGMIVADNGSNWYVSGAPDSRWSDDHLSDLGRITGDAFEAVDTGPIKTY